MYDIGWYELLLEQEPQPLPLASSNLPHAHLGKKEHFQRGMVVDEEEIYIPVIRAALTRPARANSLLAVTPERRRGMSQRCRRGPDVAHTWSWDSRCTSRTSRYRRRGQKTWEELKLWKPLRPRMSFQSPAQRRISRADDVLREMCQPIKSCPCEESGNSRLEAAGHSESSTPAQLSTTIEALLGDLRTHSSGLRTPSTSHPSEAMLPDFVYPLTEGVVNFTYKLLRTILVPHGGDRTLPRWRREILGITFIGAWAMDFSSTLGALLVSVFTPSVNTYLFGLASFQYASYYNSKFKDPLWIRLTIGGLFMTDTFHSVCIIYMAWVYAVDNFANPGGLMGIIWPFPLSAIMMTFTAFVVQLFLSYRILLLTKKLYISIPLAVLATGCFICGTIVGVRVWLTGRIRAFVSMAELSTINTVLTVWLSSETAVDVAIAAILLFILHNSKSGLKNSDRVMERLMRASLQTGVCTGVFATMCMVLWLAKPGTMYYLIFGLPISRVYTCSLLDTLLARETLRDMLDGSDTYIGSSIFGKSAGTTSALLIARPRDIETVNGDPRLGDGKPDAGNLELAPGLKLGDSWRMDSSFKAS
ncbi:hypothetical protein NMY22_g10580 [Coprinellus aureogranulatus]|nr:hypothetical protein NMY22_g10580 [Coprinellus aureogranulatus]